MITREKKRSFFAEKVKAKRKFLLPKLIVLLLIGTFLQKSVLACALSFKVGATTVTSVELDIRTQLPFTIKTHSSNDCNDELPTFDTPFTAFSVDV